MGGSKKKAAAVEEYNGHAPAVGALLRAAARAELNGDAKTSASPLTAARAAARLAGTWGGSKAAERAAAGVMGVGRIPKDALEEAKKAAAVRKDREQGEYAPRAPGAGAARQRGTPRVARQRPRRRRART